MFEGSQTTSRAASVVRVTNKNKDPITRHYEGIGYEFRPKMVLTIPELAAAHIFGWHPSRPTDIDRVYMGRTWGIPVTSDILDKFEVEGVTSHSVAIPAGMTAEEIEEIVRNHRDRAPDISAIQ